MIEYNRIYVENQKYHKSDNVEDEKKSYILVGVLIIAAIIAFI